MLIVLSRGKDQWPSASELELTPEQNSVGQCKEYFSVGRQKRLWTWTGSQVSFEISAPCSLLLQEQHCLCSCLLLLFPCPLMVSLMVLAPNARPGYLSLQTQNWAFTCATNHFKSLKGVLFNTAFKSCLCSVQDQLPSISPWGVCAIGVSKPFCCSLLPAKPGVVLLQICGSLSSFNILWGEERGKEQLSPVLFFPRHYWLIKSIYFLLMQCGQCWSSSCDGT